jgi:hypothetical protein
LRLLSLRIVRRLLPLPQRLFSVVPRISTVGRSELKSSVTEKFPFLALGAFELVNLLVELRIRYLYTHGEAARGKPKKREALAQKARRCEAAYDRKE